MREAPPRVVLFLPATIDTGTTAYISPRNPEERLQQYSQALALWLEMNLQVPIVVAENSGVDLSRLEEIASGARYGHGVEVLGFTDNQMAVAKGKGAGEIR